MEKPNNQNRQSRYLFRIFRPLLWWVILVLVLFAIHTHERLMEKTRLFFTVSMQGQQVGAEATFDGAPVEDGQHIPLGHHTFAISNPKAEPFSTNLFVWYGEHNFGNINLKRARGPLTVKVDPSAPLLTIEGPEWSIRLTNTFGFAGSIPTDEYTVTARYQYLEETHQIRVSGNIPDSLRIAPRFGTLELRCNQSDARFQLLRPNDEFVVSGGLPSIVTDLPEGTYKLLAWHHGNKWAETAHVGVRTTNAVDIDFQYGAVVLETTPSGALITTSDGRQWGATPLMIPELQRGRWDFNLRLFQYEPATISVEIDADQTNTVRTNLVSVNYSHAVIGTRQFLASGDYDAALTAIDSALQAKPNDPAALALRKEALGGKHLRQAKALAKEGNYIRADEELHQVSELLPDNQEAKQLLADFKKAEPVQREQIRLERMNHATNAFNEALSSYSDVNLFETHELRTAKPVKAVQDAIVDALQKRPAFRIRRNDSPVAESFVIVGEEEFTTTLATSAGIRRCIIAGARTGNDDTQILFKVMEYKAEAVEKFSIGALIGAPASVNYIPIHPSRIAHMTDKLQAQLTEGVSNVTARIQSAINE
jgi:hypothetical protein